MSAGRLYVRTLGPNASELVALVTPEQMQAAAERNERRAERVGVVVTQSIGRGPLGRFGKAYDLFHKLHDRAHWLAAEARKLMGRPAPEPEPSYCSECGKDVPEADLVPRDDDESVCADCHERLRDYADAVYEEDCANYDRIIWGGLQR